MERPSFRGRMHAFPRASLSSTFERVKWKSVDTAHSIQGFVLWFQITNLPDNNKVLAWNRRVLNVSGIWPLKICDTIFLPYFTYAFVIMLSGMLSLFDYIRDFEYVLSNLTENMLMVTALLKVATCRICSRNIGEFLKDIQRDYSNDNCKNSREREIICYYNQLSYRFLTIAVPTMMIVLTVYFIAGSITSVILVASNSSLEYQLPYKIRPLVKPRDLTTFILGCMYQFLSIPFIVSGYTGIDCLFASSAFHVTGQFAILRYRIEDIFQNFDNCKNDIRKIVIGHCRIIRLAETLENNFNVIIFQHLMGTTFQLCMAGYHMLVCTANGDNVQVIVFIIHTSGVLITLFVYCYIGECLIQESTSLEKALYQIDWYNMSPADLKSISICMMRSTKPLQLTSAKFCGLSLYTFTEIVKASMGYLSVLRTFL